jgi:hypothetical protein
MLYGCQINVFQSAITLPIAFATWSNKKPNIKIFPIVLVITFTPIEWRGYIWLNLLLKNNKNKKFQRTDAKIQTFFEYASILQDFFCGQGRIRTLHLSEPAPSVRIERNQSPHLGGSG